MKTGTILFLLFFIYNSSSVAQNLAWVKSMGGTDSEFGYSVAVDGSGNVYTTGRFIGTVDFDPNAGISNLTALGGYDMYIQKLDATGNLLWAKSLGGANSYAAGSSIAVDGSGNVYTTGDFQGTVDFDPNTGTSNLTSLGGYDLFIQKLDAAGNLLWAKNIGGTGHDGGESITVDGSGNVYTTGVFRGTVDFDPNTGISNLTAIGYLDIYIQKLDAAGNLLWAKNMGGINEDLGNSIVVDGSGNIYTTGYFQGTVDFDPNSGISNLTALGSVDMFIQKLDAAGNLLWAKRIGGTDRDSGESITVDGSGNVYTTGHFQGTVDFDPNSGISNLTALGSIDMFIQKLDAAGNLLWAKRIGGTDRDGGESITVDDSGNVYTTGFFVGMVDFDPNSGISNLTAIGFGDIYIQKLDAAGNLLWAKNMGGTNYYAEETAITVDSSGNVYTTGYFSGTVDFDPNSGVNNLTALGFFDIFVQKLSATTNLGLEMLHQSKIKIYPNPSTGQVTIDLDDLSEVSVKVFAISGQLIYQKENIYTTTHQFELSEVAAGIYVVEISTQDRKQYYKLIKNKK